MSQKHPKLVCDCCGTTMYSHLCKIACPNCGYRFDCSDLTLNFSDMGTQSTPSKMNNPVENNRNQKDLAE